MPRLPRAIRSQLVRRFDEAVQRAEDSGAGGASLAAEGEADPVLLAFVQDILGAFETTCRARGQEAVAASVAEAFGAPTLAGGGLVDRLTRTLRQARSQSGEGGPVLRAGVDGEWLVKRFEQVCALVWGEPAVALTPPPPTPVPAPLRPPEPATLPAGTVRYSADEVYELGTTIFHPKFGTGQVVQVETGRIRVQFRDQLRTLAQAIVRTEY